MKFTLKYLKNIALGAGLLASSAVVFAQAKSSPAVTYPANVSKFEIYGGYGAFLPISASINNQSFDSIYNFNATGSITDYFSKNWGVQVEGGYFSASSLRGSFGQCVGGACSDRDQTLYTAEAGPVYRFHVGSRIVPFVHVLGGGARVRGPYLQPLTWGYGLTAGGGVDYVLPFRFLHDHLAVRPIQADFQYEHVNYGVAPSVNLLNYYGVNDISNVKLSGGVVLRLGSYTPPPALMADCNVSPSAVFPGEPITVTSVLSNMNPKKKAMYTWSTTGGTITGNETATIATAGLAPGSYTVGGKIAQGGKIYETASCSATFTVKAYEPPTLSCSADPSTVMAGTPVTITGSGMSPQNRQLTYSFTTTSGTITGSGSKVSLATNGVPAGTVTIGCSVVDDLGKSATANTSVTISAPPPPPAPTASNLCSVSFTRDTKRPVRVDNEAKACLDDIALTLGRDSSSKLVIIGKNSPDEKPVAAAERSINVRLYLTQEKGIDPSRIDIRTAAPSDRSVDNILVPAGANYPEAGTTAVDPSTIHQKGQPYGRPGVKARRRK